MKNNETIILVSLIFITTITAFICVTVDNYSNNKMRTEILLACIQSDNCSNSMKEELKLIK